MRTSSPLLVKKTSNYSFHQYFVFCSCIFFLFCILFLFFILVSVLSILFRRSHNRTRPGSQVLWFAGATNSVEYLWIHRRTTYWRPISWALLPVCQQLGNWCIKYYSNSAFFVEETVPELTVNFMTDFEGL